ncbi:hypothetical protein scyTo_0000557 [Scyliorhinus torazame]|uniref:MACPF domain-containing protein n=1 Tax=Scyliorhinus torazame TaxID=75743 RepID=A0A401NZ84_SCYTO|nr:hypothetical protein [Scyliorhinus torazame]
MNWRLVDLVSLLFRWDRLALTLHCWALLVLSCHHQHQHATSPLDWLLSDKGPFHRARDYSNFLDRYRQGFTTRYKIYREFGRWKVNNLAVERRDFLGSDLPLAPEFIRNIRLLGRRPSPQQIIDNLIKKYGTHFLLSGTLGDLRQSDCVVKFLSCVRSDTERLCCKVPVVTETRTGPLGCSNYDNLDSVSSVLVQSPENKIHLQGLQTILPEHLRERFVEAALSYIACNSEGSFICKNHDCWCQCTSKYPECNCPYMDIQALEDSLLWITDTWTNYNKEFEVSDEFKVFLKKLPTEYFLNASTILQLWTMDFSLQHRYEQLEASLKVLFNKAQKTVRKLFSLSKRCQKQPKFVLPRERAMTYWLNRIQSFLYCTDNGLAGVFSEETRSCTCPYDQLTCQKAIPCLVGEGTSCVMCATDNRTRCGACNVGYMLGQGVCRPEVADPTEQYLGFETEQDLRDMEIRYLLQKRDSKIIVPAIFISNDVRLNSWFDPSWRKRMLLTLKSNKYKTNFVHMILGMTIQICLTKNSTLEPVLAIYVNPFGGSHSESWFMPVNEDSYPDWERTKVDVPLQCYNWTLMLGNKWKTFFETVHIYLRSRIKSSSNDSLYYEPLEFIDPSRNLGYMKISHAQVFGYSMHFDPDAIRDLILQLDYPYTQGSQDSALLQLLEIRDRVNRLSPYGHQRLDLFTCLLRHRLKLSTSEVVRIQASLQAFNAKLINSIENETTKLCS